MKNISETENQAEGLRQLVAGCEYFSASCGRRRETQVEEGVCEACEVEVCVKRVKEGVCEACEVEVVKGSSVIKILYLMI